ncbi:hypothetical protein RFI_18596 [Reticulomyxa filosa]|uniref:Uncharacterized protein n=1 Tax=Reticulomyxa filosa TaxID=46433 RepID=X6MXB2_RETFI|nr:hypothetical protein RFI_18596 [Reticulomyxa filosa]|eukprot:ETO18665.1 hypothetical protein RFI_18596 [Reticulomyxa filosa]
MLDGAPSKEHRLVEYFLVISYGDELKVRVPSPSLEIFENHENAQLKRKNELKEFLKQQFLERKNQKKGGKSSKTGAKKLKKRSMTMQPFRKSHNTKASQSRGSVPIDDHHENKADTPTTPTTPDQQATNENEELEKMVRASEKQTYDGTFFF